MPAPKGRPTKYSPDLIEKVSEYLSTVGGEQMSLPTRYKFSKFIGVDDDTLVEWEAKYPEFSAAIKQIDRTQREQLMDDGMYGGKEVNSTMAIFLLKANHGMIETERKMLVGEKGAEPVQIISYGSTDPLSVYANSSNAGGAKRSTPLPSSELASEGT